MATVQLGEVRTSRTGICTSEGCVHHGAPVLVHAVVYDHAGIPNTDQRFSVPATYAFPPVFCIGCGCEPMWVG